MKKTFNLNDGTPAVVVTVSDSIQAWTLKPGTTSYDINISCDDLSKVDPDNYLNMINQKWFAIKARINSVFNNIGEEIQWEDAEIVEPKQLK